MDDDGDFALNLVFAAPVPAPAQSAATVLVKRQPPGAAAPKPSPSPLEAVAKSLSQAGKPVTVGSGKIVSQPKPAPGASASKHAAVAKSNPPSDRVSSNRDSNSELEGARSEGRFAGANNKQNDRHNSFGNRASASADRHVATTASGPLSSSGSFANRTDSAPSKSTSNAAVTERAGPAASAAGAGMSSRRNHEKTAPSKTPIIIPVNASSSAPISASTSNGATGAAALSLTAYTYSNEDTGESAMDWGTGNGNGAASATGTGATAGKTGKPGKLTPAQEFASVSLDSRLVAKLVAPRMNQSTGAASAGDHTSSGGVGGHHVAASAGIARGHLRDGFGLVSLTRVQRGMIPLALKGANLIVKSETGSGKTLAFTLPMVQGMIGNDDSDSNAAASASSRGDGTKAIIISPTRELCAQIFAVVTRVCQPFPTIVPCLLAGGEKRKSEKARLRKGATIVIATPGRLLDHLRNTESFTCDVTTLRYLVLDEADRLLDLGFGAQIKDVVELMKTRGGAKTTSGSSNNKIATWLVSATVSPAVKELTSAVLFGANKEAVFVDASSTAAAAAALKEKQQKERERDAVAGGGGGGAGDSAMDVEAAADDADGAKGEAAPTAAPQTTFSAPKQLQQTAMLVPLKWRLVTLLAIIYQSARKAAAMAAAAARDAAKAKGTPFAISSVFSAPSSSAAASQHHCKAILFLSTTDGVDFHHALLSSVLSRLLGTSYNSSGGVGAGGKRGRSDGGDGGDAAEGAFGAASAKPSTTSGSGPHFSFPIYRLHGNVPQAERTGVFRSFAACSSGLLIATDVAARGLDLPAVDLIIQADAPSETQDYVHRIGRTARRGARGTALLLLQPHEAPYLDLLRASGLEVNQTDATTALATLADARLPVDMVAVIPTAATAAGAGSSSNGAALTKKQRRENNSSDPFAHMYGMSAADAEAAARGSSSSGSGGARGGRDGGGGDGDGRAKDANGGDNGNASGAKFNERDPTTGVPVRLAHLIEYAVKAKSRAKAGASSSYAQVGMSSSSSASLAAGGGAGADGMSRVAESFALAWQCWLEELVLLGVPLQQAWPSADAVGSAASPATAGAVVPRTPLVPLARDAFLSFVRAYSTHEKAVRHIFHPRSLHLGHAAKAFGLREQPTAASRTSRKEAEAEAAAAAAAAEREALAAATGSNAGGGGGGYNTSKRASGPGGWGRESISSESSAGSDFEDDQGHSKGRAAASVKFGGRFERDAGHSGGLRGDGYAAPQQSKKQMAKQYLSQTGADRKHAKSKLHHAPREVADPRRGGRGGDDEGGAGGAGQQTNGSKQKKRPAMSEFDA